MGLDRTFSPWVSVVWVASVVLLLFAVAAGMDMDFGVIGRSLAEADWRLVLAATALNLAMLYFRVFKWRFFFDPGDCPGFYHLSLAAFAAYTCNNLIPARIGILVQVWLLAQKENRSSSTLFATVVLLRIFDGASLALIGLLVLALVDIPADDESLAYLRRGGTVFIALFLALALALLVVRLHDRLRGRLAALSTRWAENSLKRGVVTSIERFRRGFSLLERPGRLALVVFLNLLFWLLCALSIHLNLVAFGLQSSGVLAALCVLLAQALSFMVPAPGNVGPYHLATVTALALFGVPAEPALSAAIVMHASVLLTNTLPGLVYLWRENRSLTAWRLMEKGA